jgi:TonB family protein
MRSLFRVVVLAAPAWLSAGLVWGQIGTVPREPAILVVDPMIEYFGPPGTATFEAPAISLVRRIKDFWSVPFEIVSGKSHVVAAANIDTLGAISEVSIVQPSPITAFNTAALNALARLKATPLALAEYRPNRKRLTVTFYYNEASTPGPVAPPAGWPPRGAFRPVDGVTLPKPVREVKPQYTRLAMQAGIQGRVLVEGVVQKDGSVVDAIITRSLDQTFGLDQEALKAAKQWQFVPGTRMGEPVAVVVTTELTFTLK